MDDLLFKFTQIFHEQNYSDTKMEREDSKDKIDILIIKYMYNFFQEELEETEEQNYQDLIAILDNLKNIGVEMKEKLELINDREHTETQ